MRRVERSRTGKQAGQQRFKFENCMTMLGGGRRRRKAPQVAAWKLREARCSDSSFKASMAMSMPFAPGQPGFLSRPVLARREERMASQTIPTWR